MCLLELMHNKLEDMLVIVAYSCRAYSSYSCIAGTTRSRSKKYIIIVLDLVIRNKKLHVSKGLEL